MPVAVKKLHMAKNLPDLNKLSAAAIDANRWKGKSSQTLMNSFKALYTNAKKQLESEEPDEELVYIYLFRAMEMWQVIRKSSDYESNDKYYQLMFGKDVKNIMTLLETYRQKLIERYNEQKETIKNGEVEDNLKNQFQLVPGVVLKKRKEGKGPGSDKTNGVKPPTFTDKKCIEDFNLYLTTDVCQPEEEHHEYNKFMECEALKERVIASLLDILIIDIRPQEDYQQSKIRSVHSVNIPESSIVAGLSAHKLGNLIPLEKEKFYWNQRDTYNQLVLLDWYSEQKDVIPTSPLYNLHNILMKWDLDCIYKNPPVILNGGFERFLDMYPTFTTNANIPLPEKPVSSPFIQLSDHNIEYPMNILEEEKTLPTKPTKKVDDGDHITPISRPTVDRTTKPNLLTDKMDKSDSLEINQSERSVSISEKPYQYIGEEIMEEEKVTPPVPQSVVAVAPPVPRPSEKKESHIPNVPPRPVTPPRSEKQKLISNKGDGDGEIYLERTKFETPSRGGLKRSASSPNINKLADEDLDQSSTPLFDRSIKPKNLTGYDYSPRGAGTDTVYMADTNRKGRGLTGLKNLGNLCYMNSIMQCISNTVKLSNELTRFNVKEYRGGRQIASEVSSLLRTLWQGDTRSTSCRNLKGRVGALRHSFSTMEQQDSHEFLTILMDWLHEDLNEPPIIRSLEGAVVATGEKAWGEFRQKNNSVVVDLFYGQLKSTVTCDHCQTQSVSFEPFSNLSIPLPSSQEEKDRTFTLQECLKLYLKGESIVGWVCPNCKTARKATKKLDITRLPPVLIVHLKRFLNDMVGVGWCRKRMNLVDFPISDLDMRPFTHPESELRFHNYNLYAVSNHYGSMESGHYTAYCKNHVLNKWYKFDDQDVTEISPGDVRSSAAYILFYESSQFDNQSQRIMD